MINQELAEYWRTTENIRDVYEHLRLDQQTELPPAAHGARADQIGMLEGMVRSRTGSEDVGRLMSAPGIEDGLTELERLALDRGRADRTTELQRESPALRAWSTDSAASFPAWRQAREKGDWSLFAGHLDHLVTLNRDIAEEIGYRDHPMDALLSLYAEGPTKAEVDGLFSELVGAVDDVAASRHVDPGVVRVNPNLGRNEIRRFVGAIGETIGYDFNRGGLAFAPHPFTSPAGGDDVRITVREGVPFSDLAQAAVHEFGHALYEQGIAKELRGTPAGRGIMPYIHESQSKTWENILGRRRDFCAMLTGLAREVFGGLPEGVTEETLYYEQVSAPPSLIRAGTDEVSFNQHIFLRWDIEVALLDGDIVAADVPAVWNEKAEAMFGRRPQNDAEGCLQDPHWASRYFGLFTSYVIGNLISAQLSEAMDSAGIDIAGCIEARDFSPVLGWLRSNVHHPGRAYPMKELVLRATGAPLGSSAYIRHLRSRY
jgi:carboxypeptidase Taq